MTQSLSTTTRGHRPRVALVTCAEFPDLFDDDQALIPALAARSVAGEPAVWDDPAVDWPGYDLAVLRSTWDYTPRRDEFVAWARRVPHLANPAAVVAWNTDKRYLAGLAAAGVPVVPTRYLEPGTEPWQPPEHGEYVLKPAVSAGSRDTGRYDLAEPEQRALAVAHAQRLRGAGATVMVQPYLRAVDADGETALMFFRGGYSHAIRKAALLAGPYRGLDALFKAEDITPRDADPAQLSVAERALAAVPGVRPADLLYARVDLIPGADGQPLLVELELAEPSLFLDQAPGSADRFADAIAAHVAR
ncbi:MAG TPA: hypothetical protein VJT31_26910 [Rugosimonospora sp.]|nr:hypothetical protein [Rugosimonospora sp.]